MNYWVEFSVVAGAHLLAVASPGPDFALVVRQSVTLGRKAAVATACGIGSGILVHVSYSLLGIGVLIRSSEVWFDIVKYSGAAYLLWLGGRALASRPRAAPAAPDRPGTGGRGARPSRRGAFATGFIVNVLNPKAALFFIGLFLTVISPQTPRLIQAGYGLWMAAATAAWFTLVAVFFTREDVRRGFLRFGHWFERGMGLLLVALALRLALTSLK